MSEYLDERHCDHCDQDTQHKCSGEHERDSSNDYQECCVCGWWSLAHSEYQPSHHADVQPDPDWLDKLMQQRRCALTGLDLTPESLGSSAS